MRIVLIWLFLVLLAGGCDSQGKGESHNALPVSLAGAEVSEINESPDLARTKWLSLTGTNVSDLSPLENLTNLEHLTLENNAEVSDISPLANLPNLKCLTMSENVP